MRAILHRLRPGRGTACALVVLDDCGCRPVHRNPPIHHCRRRVRFANIRRSSADRRLADRFAVEPERRPLSNPHRSCRRPAAQFNALLSAIPATVRRATSVLRRGLRKERYPLHAMIARNKLAVCIEAGPNSGSTAQSCRNVVRVHVSYRAFLRAGAFRP